MKNNLSTGIDIVSIDRVKEILNSSKRERFLKKIFSSNELKEAKLRQNEAQFFSGRFAAKEAIRKATSTPKNSSKLSFKSIDVFNYDSGKPGVNLKNDLVIDISISHDGNYAIAFCVVQ
tara:strand:- start:3931 stop:4287 length:357 start_codon:yes stop_codon:yes gene_type:complete